MRTRRLLALATLIALGSALLVGCQLTRSAFAHTASNAGSAFAAAEETLRYLHSGRATTAYAASSFVNFRSELAGIDTQLPSLQGAPGQAQIKRLVALYTPAMAAVERPCLTETCDWKGQVAAMDAASKAFLKAGSG